MPVFEVLTVDFALRLAATLIALAVLIHCGPTANRRADGAVLLCYVFGVGVFFVTYTLKSEDMSLGFAFGLFAIFSMLRYRTEQLGITEMTCLFLVIVLALLGSVSPLALPELPLVQALLVGVVVLVGHLLGRSRLSQQVLRYEKIDNIKPLHRQELLRDLAERTGLDIRHVRVDSIDFVQDSAMLTIFHAESASRA
jgi:hypothetical protein